MGFNYTKRVYDTFKGRKDLLSPTQMSVLLALAHATNNVTGRCFPGKGHLQALTLLGPSAVDEACRKLKEKGLIDITQRRIDARYNKSNLYTFLVAKWPRREGYESINVDNSEKPPREATETPPPNEPVVPRYVTPNIEHQPKERSSGASDAADGVFAKVTNTAFVHKLVFDLGDGLQNREPPPKVGRYYQNPMPSA